MSDIESHQSGEGAAAPGGDEIDKELNEIREIDVIAQGIADLGPLNMGRVVMEGLTADGATVMVDAGCLTYSHNNVAANHGITPEVPLDDHQRALEAEFYLFMGEMGAKTGAAGDKEPEASTRAGEPPQEWFGYDESSI